MTFSRLIHISTLRNIVLVLFAVLLLANGHVVTAQNTNSTKPSPSPSVSLSSSPSPSPSPSPSASPSPSPSPSASPDLGAKDRQDRLAGSWWFVLIVSGLFAGLLVPFGWTIVRAIRFSKFTFNSPLGLPEGSLRALIAFILIVFLGLYVFASILSLSEFKPPDFLVGIVATVIGFYFGSRSSETLAGTQPRTGSVQGTVVDRNNTAAVGATVELLQPGKKLTQITDLDGGFKFDNVPVGNYDIQASLAGQNPSALAKVTVTAGGTQTSSLKLQ